MHVIHPRIWLVTCTGVMSETSSTYVSPFAFRLLSLALRLLARSRWPPQAQHAAHTRTHIYVRWHRISCPVNVLYVCINRRIHVIVNTYMMYPCCTAMRNSTARWCVLTYLTYLHRLNLTYRSNTQHCTTHTPCSHDVHLARTGRGIVLCTSVYPRLGVSLACEEALMMMTTTTKMMTYTYLVYMNGQPDGHRTDYLYIYT